MVLITNKNSPHFNKKGKVHERIIEEDKILVYIQKDEAIYEFNLNEISTSSQSKQIPKTRKKFYEYIQCLEINH